MHTQVAILGAGPAGLLLAHLLSLHRIESVVLETKSRSYVESRIRAGVLEHGTAQLLCDTGVGERLKRQGMRHKGINLGYSGEIHRIDLSDLTDGKAITVYGQHEVVKDLIAARISSGGKILFEVDDVCVDALSTNRPRITFRHQGQDCELTGDWLAGCDGSHGVSRTSVPPGALRVFEKNYPFAWLGILAEAAPSWEELIYAHHEEGFALFSMRSPSVTRLYLQCKPDEDLSKWPDERIWENLERRLSFAGSKKVRRGKILQKGVTTMRSLAVEPMQYGRLFLAGDAAHIVPPTGAKGMNLAVSDVWFLTRALADFYSKGRTDLLESYSNSCLRRVWKAQRFSWWMTCLMHRFDHDDAFELRRQLAELDYLTSSRAAATALAENYVGLPWEG
ncbi:MAG: 4-hydroxybenzoate 3-monooxygenase [Verrucomicrobia bacterium]|nr:4-hydroxybenzoate 3-monooxygenase [Verrucomicrobiota bacterium]